MGTFTKPASEFKDIPMVRAHTTTAGVMVAREAAQLFDVEIESQLALDGTLEFDSPLEVVFWVWWQAARQVDLFCRENVDLQPHVDVEASGSRYVIDFVVSPDTRKTAQYVKERFPLIGVELDGHAYHETTPDQATSRNQRDRTLQRAGWHLFHFSFKEFMNDPEQCLWEVVEFARKAYWQAIAQHAEQRSSGDQHPAVLS